MSVGCFERISLQESEDLCPWAYALIDPTTLVLALVRSEHPDVAGMSTRRRVMYALRRHYEFYLKSPSQSFESEPHTIFAYVRIRMSNHEENIAAAGMSAVWDRTTTLLDFIVLRRLFDPDDQFFVEIDFEHIDCDNCISLADWTLECLESGKLNSVIQNLARKGVFSQFVKRILFLLTCRPYKILEEAITSFLTVFCYADAMKMAVEIGLIPPIWYRLGYERDVDNMNVVLANRIWFLSEGVSFVFFCYLSRIHACSVTFP
jgi:hypothetical protein